MYVFFCLGMNFVRNILNILLINLLFVRIAVNISGMRITGYIEYM